MNNQLIKSDIKLSIGILVSNRIQHIRQVMESIKPLLSAVPSELIVVDTKGEESDGSIDIVREYTDHVYPFTWCNDFAAARNVCLEHSHGEWFMFHDDDECFDDVTELIDFFLSGECNRYQCASYYIHDYADDGTYSIGTVLRLFRRRSNLRFEGRIHETLNEIHPPCKQFSCFIRHYGYAFKSLEEAVKHQERNVSIMRIELEHTGHTPRLCAQMTQELIYLEPSADEGLQFALNSLAVFRNSSQLENPFSQYLMYATVLYYVRKNDYAKTAEQIQFLMTHYPLNEVTRLVLHGIHANMALEAKDIPNMLFHAQEYLTFWQWAQTHPDELTVQSVFNFTQFYTDSYFYRIVHIGAAAANESEQYYDAKSFWNLLPWNAPDFDKKLYQSDLQITLDGLKRVQNLKAKLPEILQIFEVLSDASSQQEHLLSNQQASEAEEIRNAMYDLLSTLQYILSSVLTDSSPALDAIRNALTKIDTRCIAHIMLLFHTEATALLDKNKS